MLRAISEIAVASSVRSVPVNPRPDASSRALERARTTSSSFSIATRISSATVVALLQQRGEVLEALLEVERGVDVLQAQPELHHGERDLRRDADDDRLRAAQPRHVGDPAERAR